jgi:hypothetical protein
VGYAAGKRKAKPPYSALLIGNWKVLCLQTSFKFSPFGKSMFFGRGQLPEKEGYTQFTTNRRRGRKVDEGYDRE